MGGCVENSKLPGACSGCPLASTAKGFCPPTPVKPHHKLVAWGEAPGATEGEIGHGFTGQSGKLLREWHRRAGLDVASAWPNDMPKYGRKEDVAYRNVVLCVRPGNQFPTDEEAHECLRRHQKTGFAEFAGDSAQAIPWVTYGANATRVLTGVDLPPTKTRGTFLPLDSRLTAKTTKWIVSSLHPAFLLRGGGEGIEEGKAQGHLKPLLGADAKRALDQFEPIVPEVTQAASPLMLPAIPAESIVSIDIEGSNGKPNIVGICWDTREVYVLPWSVSLRGYLNDLFHSPIMPTFHNAAYDVAELQEAGVKPPNVWYDTINIAALYDPEQPMNLQTQVLTHVPGSTTWKGLINHENGPDYVDATVAKYRGLWANVLSRLNRPVPDSGTDWYAFYNGLDTAWGLALALNLQAKLERQGRWDYYEHVMMPLQRPLIEIGNRGMPCDEAKIEEHRVECLAKVEAATAVLVEHGRAMLAAKCEEERGKVYILEANKAAAKLRGEKFTMQKELTALKAKTKLKDFNPDSHPQRAALLYTWYGLPPIKNQGAKGYTTDDTAVADLISRLQRDTIKPKRGTKDEVLAVLQAMTDVKKWATLERTFLHPELR